MGYGQYGGNSRDRNNPLARIGTIGAAPKREVFPSSEIPHKWAHQTQSRARNAQGNLFFNGPTIYSYRESWPLARIYTRRKPPIEKGVTLTESLVLTNSERYSVTTAGQQHDVNQAARHLPCIAVPNVECNGGADGEVGKHEHDANLKYLAEIAADALAKAQRAMSARSVAYLRGTAQDAITDSARYMKFFGIRRKAPAFPEIAWNAACARAERIENPDPVRDARKIKARNARQAAQRAALQKEFDAYCALVNTWNNAVAASRATMPDAAAYWRAHGAWPASDIRAVVPYAGYKQSRRFHDAGFTLPAAEPAHERTAHVLLRVDGDQITTSEGARIPLAQAPRLWALVEQCRLNGGRTFQGHIKAGDYAIRSIGADGTLTVGCHVIPHSELALMARQLGLEISP